MGWEIKHIEESNIVETVYEGNLLKDELKKAILSTVVASMEKKSIRLLADCSQLTGGHSLFDLYENASKIPGVAAVKDLKEAVLMPAADMAKEKVEFWETVATNFGMKVKIFSDRGAAIKWLSE